MGLEILRRTDYPLTKVGEVQWYGSVVAKKLGSL